MIKYIKAILKRMFPPSRQYFNRRMESVDKRIESLSKRYVDLSKKIEGNNSRSEGTSKKLDDLNKRSEDTSKKLDILNNNIVNFSNMLAKSIDTDIKFQKDTKIRIERIEKRTTEVLWGQIFNSTINNSSWLKDKTFSPGRWAIGYPFLYVLYRVLNEIKPKNILELGLGQSTRMISQYASYMQVCHDVVEHDDKWISFFKKDFLLPKQTQVVKLDLHERSYLGDDKVIAYKDFMSTFINNKYDFISIDGPFGGMAQIYARVDVLDIIPECLRESFVILVDDYNRSGEQKMVEVMCRKLEESHVAYKSSVYSGEKALSIITSEDLGFLCSL